MLIDSHIHLDHVSQESFDALTARAMAGEYRALVPGISPEQWLSASKLCGVDWIDLAFGLHPWESQTPPENWEDTLRVRLQDASAVAIGEVGLDHARWKSGEARERAAAVFVRQLKIAAELGLPLVVHCVRAHADATALVRRFGKGVRGVVHAFSGSQDEYLAWRNLGFVVGLGSMVTRPEAKRVRAAASIVTDGSFLLETDAPFMTVSRERNLQILEGSGLGIDDIVSEISMIRGVEDRFLIEATSSAYRAIFARP